MPPQQKAQSSSEAPQAFVEIENGFYEGLEWPVRTTEDVVVGRGNHVDLVLTEPTISRAHAKLGFDGRRVFVRDLGSVNGTLINGVPKESAVLSDGDVIQMGQLVLRVRLPGRSEGGESG